MIPADGGRPFRGTGSWIIVQPRVQRDQFHTARGFQGKCHACRTTTAKPKLYALRVGLLIGYLAYVIARRDGDRNNLKLKQAAFGKGAQGSATFVVDAMRKHGLLSAIPGNSALIEPGIHEWKITDAVLSGDTQST